MSRIVIHPIEMADAEQLTVLLRYLETWACAAGVARLELRVEVDNEPALALYCAMGFTVEDRIERTVSVDGKPVDELVMAMWLAQEGQDAPSGRGGCAGRVGGDGWGNRSRASQ